MSNEPYRVPYFGDHWDVPMLEDSVQVPTPMGQRCLYCEEEVEEGDQGVLRPYAHMVDGEWLSKIVPVHRECELRQTMGGINCLTGLHSRCGGGPEPDTDPPGLSKREAAKLVLEWTRAHRGAR